MDLFCKERTHNKLNEVRRRKVHLLQLLEILLWALGSNVTHGCACRMKDQAWQLEVPFTVSDS